MAGNTKLVGFGTESRVQLERWGKKMMVQLSEESSIALLDACTNKLPKSAPERPMLKHDMEVRYDSTYGRIHISMPPEVVSEMLSALADSAMENEFAANLAEELKGSVKLHEDYLNSEGEPGVEDPQ